MTHIEVQMYKLSQCRLCWDCLPVQVSGRQGKTQSITMKSMQTLKFAIQEVERTPNEILDVGALGLNLSTMSHNDHR